jgi:hypothetical protein
MPDPFNPFPTGGGDDTPDPTDRRLSPRSSPLPLADADDDLADKLVAAAASLRRVVALMREVGR